MTDKRMKLVDLRRWNRLQLALMQRLGVPLEPEAVTAFGEWFASVVNHLGRLPRPQELEALQDKPVPPDPDNDAE